MEIKNDSDESSEGCEITEENKEGCQREGEGECQDKKELEEDEKVDQDEGIEINSETTKSVSQDLDTTRSDEETTRTSGQTDDMSSGVLDSQSGTVSVYSDFTVQSAPAALQDTKVKPDEDDFVVIDDDVIKENRRQSLLDKPRRYDPEDGLILDEICIQPAVSLSLASVYLTNGQVLITYGSSGCATCCGFQLDTTAVPPELASTQLTAEDYKLAGDMLNETWLLKFHSVCYNKWLLGGAMLILFLLTWLIGYGAWRSNELETRTGVMVFLLVGIFVVVALGTSYFIVRKKLYYLMRAALADINDILMKYHVFVGFEEHGAWYCYNFEIHFVYFEEGECLEHLMHDIGKLNIREPNKKLSAPDPSFSTKEELTESGSIVIPDTDNIIPDGEVTEIYRQTVARELLLRYSGSYVKHLVSQTLWRPRSRRHFADVPCMCQFIERTYFKLEEQIKA